MVKISKIFFRGSSRVGEIELGGGDGTPAPNSVNSDSIEDGSIKEEDLNEEIQDKLSALDDSNVISEEEAEECWEEAMANALNDGTSVANTGSGTDIGGE